MAYSIRRKDKSLTDALRRITQSQIDSALEELDDPELPRPEKIHQLRKRGKKIRALLRLVRSGFKDYDEENAAFRDIAALFSTARDATAHLETLDDLARRFGDELTASLLNGVRHDLHEHRAELDDEAIETALLEARHRLLAARERSVDWKVKGDDAKVLEKGIAKTYGRGREAMATARRTGRAEDYHEWRKRVKYHWYHARLLKHLWDGPMDAWIDEAKALGSTLGDHHDLAVFETEVLPGLSSPSSTGHELIVGLLHQEMKRLSTKALARGDYLFAEPEDALAARFRGYWEVWRR